MDDIGYSNRIESFILTSFSGSTPRFKSSRIQMVCNLGKYMVVQEFVDKCNNLWWCLYLLS